MASLIGTTLAAYKIESLLGEGGMGAVYRARHTQKGYAVAIKVLSAAEEETAEAKKRFKREAAIHSELSHPNVVSVFDVGIESDLEYLVMELVEGQTLHDYITNQSPLQLDFILPTTRNIALALGYLHERNIIHRDLKPRNVLISDRGEVKVADFGLSKMLHRTQMTAAGQFVGTLLYTAPEVMAGANSSIRSDIYSLGACLYEMLSGKRPYDADDIPGMLKKFRRSTPTPLAELVPGISPELERLVDSCLEKDPDERPTAAELEQGLKRLSGGSEAGPDSLSGSIDRMSRDSLADSGPSKSASRSRSRSDLRDVSWTPSTAPPIIAPPEEGVRRRTAADPPEPAPRPRRWPAILALVCLGAIGGTGWYFTVASSPSRRLAAAFNSKDAAIRRQVASALGEGVADSTALRALNGALKDPDGTVRVAAARALNKLQADPKEHVHSLLDFARSDNSATPQEVSELLNILSPDRGVALAVEQIKDAGRPPPPRWLAILDQIRKISASNVVAISDLLISADPALGRVLCHMLERTGTDAARASPSLQRIYEDGNSSIRADALAALAAVSTSADLRATLTAALKDTDSAVRSAAIRALATKKGLSTEELETLIASLADADPAAAADVHGSLLANFPTFVARPESIAYRLSRPGPAAHSLALERLAGAASTSTNDAIDRELKDLVAAPTTGPSPASSDVTGDLAAVGVQPSVVVPMLKGALRSTDRSIKLAAIVEMGRFGPGAATAVAELTGLVTTDADLEIRVQAATALGAIGPQAGEARPALVDAINKGPPAVQRAALQSLAQMGPIEEPLAGVLLSRLGSADRQERHAAIEALANPGQGNLLGAVTERLQAEQPILRDAALEVLGLRGDQSKESLATINSIALHDNDPIVRRRAIWAMSRISPRAEMTIDASVALLKDEAPEARVIAAGILAAFGPRFGSAATGAQEALLSGLSDPTPAVRARTVASLLYVEPLPTELLEGLIRSFVDPDDRVRAVAATVLGRHPAQAKGAFAALTELTRDPKPAVRQAAKTAIERLRGK